MRFLPALAALAIAAIPILPAAAGVERVVGAATLTLENKASGRKLPTELWYEAASGARAEDFSFRTPLRSLAVARAAAPAGGKRPLIVLSHGNWGTRYSQGWLAVELVKAGFVVLSTSHPGTVADDQSAAGRYRLWDRSRDVSFSLDQILRQPRWWAITDENRQKTSQNHLRRRKKILPVPQHARCSPSPRARK